MWSTIIPPAIEIVHFSFFQGQSVNGKVKLKLKINQLQCIVITYESRVESRRQTARVSPSLVPRFSIIVTSCHNKYVHKWEYSLTYKEYKIVCINNVNVEV